MRSITLKGWLKIHIGIDEETLEVWAVEITSSYTGDAPILPEILKNPSRSKHRQRYRRWGV